jgi:hypothetical protein
VKKVHILSSNIDFVDIGPDRQTDRQTAVPLAPLKHITEYLLYVNAFGGRFVMQVLHVMPLGSCTIVL